MAVKRWLCVVVVSLTIMYKLKLQSWIAWLEHMRIACHTQLHVRRLFSTVLSTVHVRRFAVRMLIELMSRVVNVMSLRHTWQYVVSKLFHITGYSVSFVRNVTEADAVPFCELLIHRNVTFLTNLLKFHSQHLVIGYLVRHSGKNELHELSDIL